MSAQEHFHMAQPVIYWLAMVAAVVVCWVS